MLKVYHVPLTRSLRVVWLLEELGVTDYKLELIPRSEFYAYAKTDAYMAINPLSKFPAMTDGPLPMIESIAIMEYLLAKYANEAAEKKLLPPDTDLPAYGEYLKWLQFGEGGMGTYVVMLLGHTSLLPEEHRSKGVAKWAKAETMKCLDLLARDLEGRDYLCASGFTAADISVAYMLFLLKLIKQFDDAPEPVKAYWSRLTSRPAWEKTSRLGM